MSINFMKIILDQRGCTPRSVCPNFIPDFFPYFRPKSKISLGKFYLIFPVIFHSSVKSNSIF